MNKLIVVLFWLFISLPIFAYDLIGSWEINIEKSLDFNKKNINMSPVAKSLFKCSISHTKLIFLSKKYELHIAGHECAHDDKKSYINGVYEKYEYNLVLSNANQGVLKITHASNNEKFILVNWINNNEFWLDQSDAENIVRYFYKRKG